MTGKIYDVAIVGMGPVGAAAAILFADSGLDVAIVEKAEEIYPLPRAVGMDGEVVRAFQKLGAGEEFNNLLQQRRPKDRVGFANSKREWMFGQEWAEFGVNGWQPVAMFDQPEIEQYLRDKIETYPGVDTFLGHEVTSFSDLDSKITLTCTAPGAAQTMTIDALYLVACDGAASPVRKGLDINWHDLGYDHDWLVIDVVVKDGHTLNQDTLQVCDPDRIVTHVVTKDPFRRWEFKLNPGETWEEMLEPEKIYELLDPWTPRHTYTLRRKAVYQFHAATADEWRRGRIFIAGDAAHQTPPFLGQGMNAGMRDVINLAWKLPMVIKGVTSDRLLDTYQSERMPHAQDLVEWAVAVGQLMEHLAAAEAAERDGR
jgi:3-(3-hydroxy-phenyl)propionate hydroxylase